jgi:hypothetical protein
MPDEPRGLWTVRVEWRPQDLWIGAFWKREEHGGFILRTFDLWVCLVPCLPIHFSREVRAA